MKIPRDQLHSSNGVYSEIWLVQAGCYVSRFATEIHEIFQVLFFNYCPSRVKTYNLGT